MKENIIQEDEIDLRELFKIIWNKRLFISLFTFIITLISIMYVLVYKPIPLYEGSVLIEIGEIQNKNFPPILLEKPENLSVILNTKLNMKSEVPIHTNQLLKIKTINTNQSSIEKELNAAIEFILKRHDEKARFYQSFIPTKQIGNVEISKKPINTPKKKLIVVVAFITSFIMAIFLVFFMQFIKSFREERID